MKTLNENLRKYVFFTEEGLTTAPNEEDVDNFQVLGFAQGKDFESAKQVLLEENEWTLRKGFSIAKIRAVEIIDHSKLVITKKKGNNNADR